MFISAPTFALVNVTVYDNGMGKGVDSMQSHHLSLALPGSIQTASGFQ